LSAPLTQSARAEARVAAPRRRRWRVPSLSRSAAVGLAIVGGITLLSLLAPVIGLPDPTVPNYTARLLSPSPEHPFGTDHLGRDVLNRVIWGGRTNLQLGFITAMASLVIGMSLGIFAGYYGGGRENLLMRVVDTVAALPFIVLVLAIVAVIGDGLTGIYIGIIAISWTIYARLSYSEMRVLRERQFILAARTLAFSDARIVFKHAVPNILRPNLAFVMSDIVFNILALAGLSYLGVGVDPPTPEWGAIIAEGQVYLQTAWWITTMPGLMVVLVGLGFMLLADWINRSLGDTGRHQVV
jgi:peptide/nickel transport system permease protein